MKTLNIKNLGPIQSANIDFGDLTFFVGPQASGKSIVLQMVKLLEDKAYIRRIYEEQGFTWPTDSDKVLDLVLGEGMAGIWEKATELEADRITIKQSQFRFKTDEPFEDSKESVFYIPAQRVMCFQGDWLKSFYTVESSAPFVLKNFSEQIRQYSDKMLLKSPDVFPKAQYLKAPIRKVIESSVYQDGNIKIDNDGRKRFKQSIGKNLVPFMSWSAGQKEFMSLLLSFYLLCPPSKASKKTDVNTIIIEEPEMGLHPKAIEGVILQILDLMERGYKVIVSTHSPVFLEFAWAFTYFKEVGFEDGLFELFSLPKKDQQVKQLFSSLLEKEVKTYFFDRQELGVKVRDISTLDAEDTNSAVANWGGLSSFASRALDIVATHAANAD